MATNSDNGTGGSDSSGGGTSQQQQSRIEEQQQGTGYSPKASRNCSNRA